MKRTKVGLTALEERMVGILRYSGRPTIANEVHEILVECARLDGAVPSLSAVSAALRRLARKGHALEHLRPVYSAAKRRAP